jgi:uncharacterized membrane protein YeaQ/YmgE (transglycosylase-associated protein family)
MAVLGWVVLGVALGIVAKLVMPGRDPGGFVATGLVGILGALLGGYLGWALGWYGGGEPAGFGMAGGMAVVLLALYRLAFLRGPLRD